MNHGFKDETGNTYGRLTVIRYDHTQKKKAYWLCRCSCGREKVVAGDKLRNGRTTSCGCYQTELRKSGNHKTHGMTKTRLYYEWSNMRSRCDNPNNIMYDRYGGRGVRHCEDWDSFEAFRDWALSNGYRDDLTLERVDVDGNYEPSNCKWITKQAQALNRSDNHVLTAFGKTQTIKEWADETGIKYDTIHARVKYYGWSAEDAVSIRKRR